MKPTLSELIETIGLALVFLALVAIVCFL